MDNMLNVIHFIGVGEFDSALFRNLNLNWDAQLRKVKYCSTFLCDTFLLNLSIAQNDSL